MLSCPHCNAKGTSLDWCTEITVTGKIASIKCRECSWTSPIIIDGRIKMLDKVEDIRLETEDGLNICFQGDAADVIERLNNSGKFVKGFDLAEKIAEIVGYYLDAEYYLEKIKE